MILLFLCSCSNSNELKNAETFVKKFYGAVSGDEPRSVLEARKILSKGGSAADAATAMYFSLAVTLPSAASLGGGGSCLVFQPNENKPGWGKGKYKQKIEALEFFTRPPRVVPPTATRPSAVPGNVGGMFALHARYGKLPWREMVVVGEKLARFGVSASRALMRDLARVEEALLQDQTSNQIFRGLAGGLLKEGKIIFQPDLANTLSNIRVNGRTDFYRGKLAELLVNNVIEVGGALSLDDLKKFKPQWVKPISMDFAKGFLNRNKAYFVPPPAAAGVLQAQILGMLNRGRNFANASAKTQYHLLAETSLIAYVERARWMQDDFKTSLPEKELVSNRILDRLQGQIDDRQHRQLASFKPKPMPENPSATSFVVIDSLGMAISCAFTMNNNFGIGRIATNTGIMLAATPKGIGRGSISLGPMMIINPYSSQFVLASSASGGVTAATALSSVVARSYLMGQSLEVSVAAPRVHHSGSPDITYYEPNLQKDVISHLVKKGHNMAATPRIGLVNVAYCSKGLPRDPETCNILHDTRGHGLAITATGLTN